MKIDQFERMQAVNDSLSSSSSSDDNQSGIRSSQKIERSLVEKTLAKKKKKDAGAISYEK